MTEKLRTEPSLPCPRLAAGEKQRRSHRFCVAVPIAMVLLAGCAATDDARKEPIPGEDASYTKLGTVPDRPSLATTAAERQEIANQLVGDRDKAEDRDKAVRSRNWEAAAPPSPAKTN